MTACPSGIQSAAEPRLQAGYRPISAWRHRENVANKCISAAWSRKPSRCEVSNAAKPRGRSLRRRTVPIKSTAAAVEKDGCLRPDTTAAGLAQLKAAFDKDVPSLRTSSPLTDGASAVLVCSEEYASKHGLKALPHPQRRRCRMCTGDHGHRTGRCQPQSSAAGQSQDVRHGCVELNEAFASQSLACAAISVSARKSSISTRAIALAIAGRDRRAYRR